MWHYRVNIFTCIDIFKYFVQFDLIFNITDQNLLLHEIIYITGYSTFRCFLNFKSRCFLP